MLSFFYITLQMSARAKVLTLYRQLLRESAKWPNYSYRSYAQRKIRDSFRANRSLAPGPQLEQVQYDDKAYSHYFVGNIAKLRTNEGGVVLSTIAVPVYTLYKNVISVEIKKMFSVLLSK